jgi:hypothetical protein
MPHSSDDASKPRGAAMPAPFFRPRPRVETPASGSRAAAARPFVAPVAPRPPLPMPREITAHVPAERGRDAIDAPMETTRPSDVERHVADEAATLVAESAAPVEPRARHADEAAAEATLPAESLNAASVDSYGYQAVTEAYLEAPTELPEAPLAPPALELPAWLRDLAPTEERESGADQSSAMSEEPYASHSSASDVGRATALPPIEEFMTASQEAWAPTEDWTERPRVAADDFEFPGPTNGLEFAQPTEPSLADSALQSFDERMARRESLEQLKELEPWALPPSIPTHADAAAMVAEALDRVARRLRNGELLLPPDLEAESEAAALAAALTAVLRSGTR